MSKVHAIVSNMTMREAPMNPAHIRIDTGITHANTAENIYLFLRDNRAILGGCDFVIQLDGTATSLRIKEMSRGTLSIFPAVAKGTHVSWGNFIGRGEHIPAAAIMPEAEEAHEMAVEMLANVVTRTISHRDNDAASVGLDEQTAVDMRAEARQ